MTMYLSMGKYIVTYKSTIRLIKAPFGTFSTPYDQLFAVRWRFAVSGARRPDAIFETPPKPKADDTADASFHSPSSWDSKGKSIRKSIYIRHHPISDVFCL